MQTILCIGTFTHNVCFERDPPVVARVFGEAVLGHEEQQRKSHKRGEDEDCNREDYTAVPFSRGGARPGADVGALGFADVGLELGEGGFLVL